MKWQEIRQLFPEQWVILEAFDAHTENDERVISVMSVVDTTNDGQEAFKLYGRWQKQFPHREFFFYHTHHPLLKIKERQVVGLRGGR